MRVATSRARFVLAITRVWRFVLLRAFKMGDERQRSTNFAKIVPLDRLVVINNVLSELSYSLPNSSHFLSRAAKSGYELRVAFQLCAIRLDISCMSDEEFSHGLASVIAHLFPNTHSASFNFESTLLLRPVT